MANYKQLPKTTRIRACLFQKVFATRGQKLKNTTSRQWKILTTRRQRGKLQKTQQNLTTLTENQQTRKEKKQKTSKPNKTNRRTLNLKLYVLIHVFVFVLSLNGIMGLRHKLQKKQITTTNYKTTIKN